MVVWNSSRLKRDSFHAILNQFLYKLWKSISINYYLLTISYKL